MHNYFESIIIDFEIQHSKYLCSRAGSDGSMSASGSAGPGFNPRRGSKF